VLSYTLSNDVVEELAKQARRYCPRCPLIAISDTRRTGKESSLNETVFGEDGPASLIAALRRVCRDIH